MLKKALTTAACIGLFSSEAFAETPKTPKAEQAFLEFNTEIVNAKLAEIAKGVRMKRDKMLFELKEMPVPAELDVILDENPNIVIQATRDKENGCIIRILQKPNTMTSVHYSTCHPDNPSAIAKTTFEHKENFFTTKTNGYGKGFTFNSVKVTEKKSDSK